MPPVHLLDRLMSYYRKDAKKNIHVLPVHSAALLSLGFTLFYVLPFYLFKKTRPSLTLSRDAPSVIRARIRAVTFSSLVCTAVTVYVATYKCELTTRSTLQILGWWPLQLMDILKTLSLLVLLFMGPLFEAAIIERRWSDWLTARYLHETLASSIGWRTFVAGPITEELVFRSLIVPLHIMAQTSLTKLIFVTPLYFGIAHIHHCYEFILTHPDASPTAAIARSAFQFGYTSIFGFYAAFVFLRTGNLPAVILAHSFCNWMGLPRFWGRIEAPVPLSPPSTKAKEDADVVAPAHQKPMPNAGDSGLGWTVAYYIILITGAVLFSLNFWTLTDSSNKLVDFANVKTH